MYAPANTRRLVTVCLATLIAVVFLYTSFTGRGHGGGRYGGYGGAVGDVRQQQQQVDLLVSQDTLMGPAIAPKLGNETVKLVFFAFAAFPIWFFSAGIGSEIDIIRGRDGNIGNAKGENC